MKSKLQQCRAAVILETAMVLFMFLGLVLAIMVFSMAAFRYALLSDTVAHSLRTLSVDASAGYGSCSNLSEAITDEASDYLLNTYGISAEGHSISLSGNILKVGVDPSDCRATIALTAAWPFPCYICSVFNLPSSLIITDTRAIEDSIFRRCGYCDSCPEIVP